MLYLSGYGICLLRWKLFGVYCFNSAWNKDKTFTQNIKCQIHGGVKSQGITEVTGIYRLGTWMTKFNHNLSNVQCKLLRYYYAPKWGTDQPTDNPIANILNVFLSIIMMRDQQNKTMQTKQVFSFTFNIEIDIFFLFCFLHLLSIWEDKTRWDFVT